MDDITRPRRRRQGGMDGFIPNDSFRSTGSIDFQKKAGSTPINDPKKLDDFNRPEGYHPGVQPLIKNGAAATTASAPALSTAPRQRGRHGESAPVAGAPQKKHGKLTKKRNWKKIFLRTLLVLTVLVIIVGGFLGYKVWKNTSKVFHGNIFGLFDNTKLKGEDQGRVNILITGTSEDDPGHDGALLTDSIMVASINTQNNTGFILSIPRDLWVSYGTSDCSAGNEGKINAVYECGEEVKFKEDGYPDGGLGLMEKVIHDNFGLNINYYAKIDYTAFRDSVNAVGGIDVNIKTDDPRGLYDGNIGKQDGGPLKLPNGTVHLDGQTALNLARARCDTVCYGFTRGDFDRTEHQRMMLFSLKDKAMSAGVLSNPAKISSLLDSIGNNVKTDFKTSEIRRLYDLSKQIPNSSVKSIGLADDGVNLVNTGMVGNSSIVKPVAGIDDFSQIKAYIQRLTSNDPVVQEGATVVVLNGSGVTGLAAKQSDVLANKGITVKAVGNTTTRQITTIVAKNPQKTATNSYLNGLYKVTSTTDTTANPEAKNYDADFVIILGSNAATTN